MIWRNMLMAASQFGGGAAPAVFSATPYTGNGTSQSINCGVDLSSSGGMVWVKKRTSNESHIVADTVRGSGLIWRPDSTSAAVSDADTITAFSSVGFDIGADLKVNQVGQNYVAWAFKKEASFLDVVTFTGDGAASKTISHSLGSAPGMIVLKRLDANLEAFVYHRSANLNGDNAPETDYARLASNGAFADSNLWWNDTAPTDTQFTVGSVNNTSGGLYVAYLFAHDPAGEIQCGGYTGNGSAAGPIVSLGWEPQFLMIKREDSSGGWLMYDSARSASNPRNSVLYADTITADTIGPDIDFTASEFQPKSSDISINASGGRYIYMAIKAA